VRGKERTRENQFAVFNRVTKKQQKRVGEKVLSFQTNAVGPEEQSSLMRRLEGKDISSSKGPGVTTREVTDVLYKGFLGGGQTKGTTVVERIE